MKYLGTLDHPVAKMITDGAKKGEVVLVEISPKFFSTWDYGKMQRQRVTAFDLVTRFMESLLRSSTTLLTPR
jgi:hypothetical protein